jgi:ATP-binding cassette subfamily B (MDR/TAP) protein 1
MSNYEKPPSISLLFSLITSSQFYLLLVPAIASSILAGAIAPFMTVVIGQVFNAFAQFPLSNPTAQDRHKLLTSVGISAGELVGLAFGSLILSSTTSFLWISVGERNVFAIRSKVYAAVTSKGMDWFDTKMGAESSVQSQDGEQGALGAGGLMSKFSRETDDVRSASSLASGLLIQYLATCITCLGLAFARSWALTLVILASVPILVFVQGLSQGLASPLVALEREQSATAASLIDRALSAISTVKAFNAAKYEHNIFSDIVNAMNTTGRRLNAVWGFTSGTAQFVMMGMFVQAFWFGSKLVRDGKVPAGDVMAVFWACLTATSNLQMCIPQFITLAKGKFAMSSLLSLVNDEASAPGPRDSTCTAPSRRSFPLTAKVSTFRRIVPQKCIGEFSLHDVCFSYPSRPDVPVLRNVSLFLPAGETTFIVGSSGSGKSTIAQLLLRLYNPTSGIVQFDDQDITFLEESWMKQNVAGVSQSCILFDMSVHDNVALGALGSRTVSREEVIQACRIGLMHEFVRDLPEGYDTVIGNGGAALSGGQRQRLAIARACIRDPNVLILDEATSALDATSRLLVFEAIKRWRKNRTTIVITHDLSQISEKDFVYVLKGGEVVQQGYRYDLQDDEGDVFAEMAKDQLASGGCLPEKDIDAKNDELDALFEDEPESPPPVASTNLKHQSIAMRPLTMGNWMFDVVSDLTTKNGPPPAALVAARATQRLSRFVPTEAFPTELPASQRVRKRSSVANFMGLSIEPPSPSRTVTSRRLSLQFTPSSPSFAHRTSMVVDDEDFEDEKAIVQRNANTAAGRRGQDKVARKQWEGSNMSSMTDIKVDRTEDQNQDAAQGEDAAPQPSLFALIRAVWPTIPGKPWIALGLLAALCSGAMTPIFSFLLSRLLFEVSIGAQNISTINTFGALVLGIAALDGMLLGLKYFIMETTALSWVSAIRLKTFNKLLSQDKKFFDKSENASVRLVQIMIKDGDDARNLIAVVLGQSVVVITMLSVGLIWALVVGWQLTLVGFAIAPVFAGVMSIQTKLVNKVEMTNKRKREEVAKGYYEAISNIRAIRAMSFETVFQAQFTKYAEEARSAGVKGALVEGCTYGVASGLIYLAEAILFFVGAVLVSKGTYTYLQLVQVLNLVVFTVTIGSQLMAFTSRIAKAMQATNDFNRLLKLPNDTEESHGSGRPPLGGSIAFEDVSFSYPERAEVSVLKNVDLRLEEGECVAIVGASGSGKSTVASLLQRLYKPESGQITIGGYSIGSIDVAYLRDHVSVVSQNPTLFNASIADNIKYGGEQITPIDIRKAAKSANVHEFIMGLPQGYDTLVGDNASLISGGQAQRICIARALARPSNILILDECTSSLDSSNSAVVLDTIKRAKVGRTTIMVTHKLEAMKSCDRIIVMDEGRVVECGTYHSLVEKRGVFATLASAGEWSSQ